MNDVPPLLGHRYLRQMAESEDVEGLIEALDDRRVQRSPSMRRLVVNELGLLGDSSAVQRLSVGSRGRHRSSNVWIGGKSVGKNW